METYPRLAASVRCDALVVGAGITGALIAHALVGAGLNVRVIDRREVGWGSTAASTALLQYEIDTELQDLQKRYGPADALLAYRTCERAIGSLLRLAKSVGGMDIQPMQSLYIASHWYHKTRLEHEGALRRQHGFDVQVLDRDALLERFGIDAPVALLTAVAAQTDPYRFAHRLLASVTSSSGRVHAHTALQDFKVVRGGVRAQTDDGMVIHCKHLIFAAGYECASWLEQRLARNRSSYAVVSEPLPAGLGVLSGTLLWESSRPYLYMRSTSDGRLVVGGEDDSIDIPIRRDARIEKQATKLVARVSAMFPELTLNVAFAWAGTFSETDDGLPFFGEHEQYGPRVLFAMAYGGNGITYSQIGAEILRDALQGGRHPCAALFSFDRLKRL